MADDSELWDVIYDGPHLPMKIVTEGKVSRSVPKSRKEYSDAYRKMIEKNFKAKKLLECGIGPDEYNHISTCETTKEIWEAMEIDHEGTSQVNQSNIDMLTTQYELFKMNEGESIQEMHIRFTSIINEHHCLGQAIKTNKLVRKILSNLPPSWERKFNAISEAKDLQLISMDELIGNLKNYKLKRQQGQERREPKKEKNLVLKADKSESSEED